MVSSSLVGASGWLGMFDYKFVIGRVGKKGETSFCEAQSANSLFLENALAKEERH
jgi:hypothetical protein